MVVKRSLPFQRRSPKSPRRAPSPRQPPQQSSGSYGPQTALQTRQTLPCWLRVKAGTRLHTCNCQTEQKTESTIGLMTLIFHFCSLKMTSCFYIRVVAARLVRLVRVGRVDHGFVVDHSVFEVTSFSQLLELVVDGLERVHTCGRDQEKSQKLTTCSNY